jgi:hypothetical protein
VPGFAFEFSAFDRGWMVAKAGTAVTAIIAAIRAAADITKSKRLNMRYLLFCEVAGCATGSLRPKHPSD